MVAIELLKQRLGEVGHGQTPGIHFDRVTFDELVMDLITDYEINHNKSTRRVKQCVAHLKESFENVPAPNISTPAIKRYIKKRMDEGAANATINRELSALKRSLNLGAKATPPKVNRTPYIPVLAENNVREGFFEHNEYLAVRDALPFYLKGPFTFAYKTGWRKEEITSIAWEHVDCENWIVYLPPGVAKNKEPRMVYLDDELIDVFKQQRAMAETSDRIIHYVFPKENGERIREFRKTWAKACKAASVGKKYFHDTRRTAVRNMVRSGIQEKVAMQISGHKTRSVFDRYNIVNDADLKQAAQKQADYTKIQDHYNNRYNQPSEHKKEVRYDA